MLMLIPFRHIRCRHAVVAAAIVLVGAGVATTGDRVAAQTAAPAAAQPTVWDRIFSEAQAARGEAIYKKTCSVCHRDDLTGYESDGPPLRGSDFWVRWRQQRVGDMLTELQQSMPMSNPGSVPVEQFVDILAFVFKVNGVPLGTTDLVADPKVLDSVMITEKTRP